MNTNPNVVVQVKRAFVSNPPAAPSAGATVVLFATHPCTLGTGGASVLSLFTRASGLQSVLIDPAAIEEIDVVFGKHDHASAANGIRAYYTNDGGATWVETDMKDPQNVATIGAGTVHALWQHVLYGDPERRGGRDRRHLHRHRGEYVDTRIHPLTMPPA